jgi:hypothetical protein
MSTVTPGADLRRALSSNGSVANNPISSRRIIWNSGGVHYAC